MTFRDYFEKHLCDHGLFGDQAKKVMDEAEADPANESMRWRWVDHVEG